MLQNCFALLIAECNVIKFYLTCDITDILSVRLVCDSGRLVKGFKDTLKVGDIVDEVIEDV